MMGSFVIKEQEGIVFAERDLAEAIAIPRSKEILQDSERNKARSSELFHQWIRDSSEGVVFPDSYWISKPSSGTFQTSSYMTAGARWPDFDQGSGGNGWHKHLGWQAW